MQKAPLNENPLDGLPNTRWSRPWHLWLESIARSFSFIGLSDSPSSYAGQAGKVIKVNVTEDGLEFGTGGGGVSAHNDLTGLQGGTTGEYYHLTSADNTEVVAFLNGGTSTHTGIDGHITDASIHFTEGSIDHTAITNIGTNSHSAIDSHIGDGTIHFTEASIDHTAIQNIGTNSHAQIDTHIADTGLHNLVFDQLAYTYTLGKETGEVVSLSASPLKTLVKTYNTSGNIATVTDGVNTWTFSYNGAGFLTGSVKT